MTLKRRWLRFRVALAHFVAPEVRRDCNEALRQAYANAKTSAQIAQGYRQGIEACHDTIESLYWDAYNGLTPADQAKWKAELGLPARPGYYGIEPPTLTGTEVPPLQGAPR